MSTPDHLLLPMSNNSNNKPLLHFIHLTDCHLGDSPDAIINGYNTFNSLGKICQHIKHHDQHPDFILFTGDISQTGTLKSYELFQGIVNQLDYPIYCLPGNHDNPLLLKKLFPDSPLNNPVFLQINGVALVLINSTVEGKEYGQIKTNVIPQFNSFFHEHPQIPTIISMHHPLVNTQTPWMDALAIHNSREVQQYFAAKQNIKLVLNGHAHMDIQQKKGHTFYLGTPSTCYQFKPGAVDLEYDMCSPGYRLISLRENLAVENTLYRIKL